MHPAARGTEDMPAPWFMPPTCSRPAYGPEGYRVTLSRLAPGVSVRTWEIQRGKVPQTIEKVTAVLTGPTSASPAHSGSHCAYTHQYNSGGRMGGRRGRNRPIHPIHPMKTPNRRNRRNPYVWAAHLREDRRRAEASGRGLPLLQRSALGQLSAEPGRGRRAAEQRQQRDGHGVV
eukprot:SAG31_NODE_12772_length_918_cov_1.096459_2_plen_174_part_01